MERAVMLGPTRIHQKVDPLVGRDFVVMTALRTDLKVAFELFFPQRFLAATALDPQTFRDDTPFVRRFHRLLLALKPAHRRFILAAPAADYGQNLVLNTKTQRHKG